MKFFMLFFLSSSVWSHPNVAVLKLYKDIAVGSIPIPDITCWENDTQFDPSLCQIVKSYYQCEKGVELRIGYRPPPDANSKIDPRLEIISMKHAIGYRDFLIEGDDLFIESFVKISSVVLVEDSNKDITKFFKIQGPYLSYSGHSDFINNIRSSSSKSTFVIKGLCSRYKSKLPVHIYPVYKNANNSSEVIGKIVLYRSSGWNPPFELNIKAIKGTAIQDYDFDRNSFGAFKQVKEVSGEYVNVGEGPWGKSGWSVIPFASMFSDSNVYFHGPSGSLLEFFKDKKGTLYKRSISSDAIKDRDDQKVGNISVAHQSDYINNKGQLILPVYDVRIARRRESEVPSLVDFSGGQFVVDGPAGNRSIPIYSSSNQDSPLLGTIHLDFKNNQLIAHFINDKNQSIEYVSDIFQGRCGIDFRFSALQNVVEQVNVFSNIGKGPWGEAGWVRESRFPITRADLPVKFKLLEREIYQIDLMNSGMHLDLNYFPRSRLSIRDLRRIREKPTEKVEIDFVQMSGKLLLEPSCKLEKIAKSSKYESRLMNLASNSIANRYEVYQSFEDNSRILGHLDSSDERDYRRAVRFTPLNGRPVKVDTLMNRSCPNQKDYLLIGVISQQGNWVELGKGPWGESAWIKGASDLVVDLELEYWHPRSVPGFLKMINDDSYVFIDRYQNKQEVRAREEIYSDEGKLLGQFNCGVKK